MAASVDSGTIVAEALGLAAFAMPGLGGGLLAQAKRNSKNPRQKHVCHLK
jgi:hypothetical protein